MKKIKTIILITILTIALAYVSNITQIPNKIMLLKGESITLKALYGIGIQEKSSQIIETWEDGNVENKRMEVTLFGNIKVKEVSVTEYPQIKVIPTGNLVGLKLYTNGVLVIGMTEIKNINDQIEKPYQNINIQEGDTILELNNQEIDSVKTLQNIVNNSSGNNLQIKYVHDGEILTSNITPTHTAENEYKLGLWVRDSATGVGTMTFYEPQTQKFAALGHGISDADTSELLDIESGEVVTSKIVNISKGKKGTPGEIKGSISGRNKTRNSK